MQRWSCRCRKTGVQRLREGDVKIWRWSCRGADQVLLRLSSRGDYAGDCAGPEVQRSRDAGIQRCRGAGAEVYVQKCICAEVHVQGLELQVQQVQRCK